MMNWICSSHKVILTLETLNILPFSQFLSGFNPSALFFSGCKLASNSAYDAIHSLWRIPFSNLFRSFHDKFAQPIIQRRYIHIFDSSWQYSNLVQITIFKTDMPPGSNTGTWTFPAICHLLKWLQSICSNLYFAEVGIALPTRFSHVSSSTTVLGSLNRNASA